MRVDFDPRTHGFAFSNNFTNKVSIFGLPITETRGRCGGMAFAALDYWHHRLSVPRARSLPQDGTPVADYIYWRLIDSIVGNWPMYFHFMRTPDHPTVVNGIGVARATREEQFPRLMSLLDSGVPQPLGLTRSRDVGQFGDDHQVVAYGYDIDGDTSRVYIWDNRAPDRECVLSFTSTYDPGNRAIHNSYGDDWRGFFVESYSPQLPNYLLNRRLLSERSDDRIFVVYGGAKFWVPSPAEFEATGYRWEDVTELDDGSMTHVADVPGDRTVIRPFDDPAVDVVYGGARFWIPNPETLHALGFSWGDVRVVPSGNLNAIGRIPRDGTLLRELTDPTVWVIEAGKRRAFPDPETFRTLGHSWDRIGLVPDGALAHLPVGNPIPPTRPLTWAERTPGHLITRDGDQIDYVVEPGQVAPDEVEFVLEQPGHQTWRKELVLVASDGRWTIGIQDAVHSARNGLYRYQLPDGQLVFRKAKAFGFMHDVYELGQLSNLPAGARVTFTWARD
jgi:hypothetical protein